MTLDSGYRKAWEIKDILQSEAAKHQNLLRVRPEQHHQWGSALGMLSVQEPASHRVTISACKCFLAKLTNIARTLNCLNSGQGK